MGLKNFASVTDGTSNTIAMSERGVPTSSTAGTITTAVATNQATAITTPINCVGLKGTGNRYATGVATSNWTVGSFSFGWQGRNAEISTIIAPNGPSCASLGDDWNTVMFTATSYHPGGVNTVLLDGSVRFVSDTIDTGRLDLSPVTSNTSPYGVWGALGSISGGESVTSF